MGAGGAASGRDLECDLEAALSLAREMGRVDLQPFAAPDEHRQCVQGLEAVWGLSRDGTPLWRNAGRT